MSIWGEDLEARIGVLQEERKALVVRVCPQAELVVLAGLGERLWVGTCFVLDQTSDATGMGDQRIEVVLWESERECKEPAEMSC